MADPDEREEELSTLKAIYPELIIDNEKPFTATLELPANPATPLLVRFVPSSATYGVLNVERDVTLTHLPPLHLQLALPDGYPADSAPDTKLSSQLDWVPQAKIKQLESEVLSLWEELGRSQTLFAYIDYLQSAVEEGFTFDQSAEGCLVLPADAEKELVAFDAKARKTEFNNGTYDCEICLEPKKGAKCYRLSKCGHVFCLQCLQDFYNSAITEGDVAGVKCLSPECGKDPAGGRKRKRERTLHPRELLAMGVAESTARRYVELKRKKKLEADKTTVYCPREWCQGPARAKKYPPLPFDLTSYHNASSDESEDEGSPAPTAPASTTTIPPDIADRLAVCEKCAFAFCKVCFMGWHGPFARCYPRDPNELSVEEKASYDYIRLNTSPCPTCLSPSQKTHGCNHMRCFQCNTHFCYLCGFWLDGQNPYQHFNKSGTPCFQRLWELEEGDDGVVEAAADGRGFGGGRGWERMALEAAREADAQEAAQAVQAEEDERAARALAGEDEAVDVGQRGANGDVAEPVGDNPDAALAPALAQFQLAGPEPPGRDAQARAPRGGRRQRNPFPAHPPAEAGQGNAVRQHERGRGGGGRGAAALAVNGRRGHRPELNGQQMVFNGEERRQQELRRFVEMAERDREEEWDSDELGEDDGQFVIW